MIFGFTHLRRSKQVLRQDQFKFPRSRRKEGGSLFRLPPPFHDLSTQLVASIKVIPGCVPWFLLCSHDRPTRKSGCSTDKRTLLAADQCSYECTYTCSGCEIDRLTMPVVNVWLIVIVVVITLIIIVITLVIQVGYNGRRCSRFASVPRHCPQAWELILPA